MDWSLDGGQEDWNGEKRFNWNKAREQIIDLFHFSFISTSNRTGREI